MPVIAWVLCHYNTDNIVSRLPCCSCATLENIPETARLPKVPEVKIVEKEKEHDQTGGGQEQEEDQDKSLYEDELPSYREVEAGLGESSPRRTQPIACSAVSRSTEAHQ